MIESRLLNERKRIGAYDKKAFTAFHVSFISFAFGTGYVVTMFWLSRRLENGWLRYSRVAERKAIREYVRLMHKKGALVFFLW